MLVILTTVKYSKFVMIKIIVMMEVLEKVVKMILFAMMDLTVNPRVKNVLLVIIMISVS